MEQSLKNKGILWGLVPLLVLTMVLGACAAPGAEAAVVPETTDNSDANPPPMPPLNDNTTSVQLELTYDELLAQKHVTREITVTRPGSVIVTLGSNATTGFSWEEAVIADASLLSQYSRQYVEPVTGMLGAAGKDVWTFKSLQPGTTTIDFDYSRSGGPQDEWTLTLTVIVK